LYPSRAARLNREQAPGPGAVPQPANGR
jgi:hypothetical protein